MHIPVHYQSVIILSPSEDKSKISESLELSIVLDQSAPKLFSSISRKGL